MPNIVGVVFNKGGKVYDFDAGLLELVRGDQVVVETVRGTELGVVAVAPHITDEADLSIPLKTVLRRATAEDLETVATHVVLRTEALATCRKLIVKHGLGMKLVDAEVMFGGGKIIFSFFAEERIDFRALVVDLAKALKMRIELRQIGVRDEARMFGGLGPCGRHLCCTLFQVDQEPVSIRMAKEQNLPLNPMKISGLCGRLMCCLKYEQEQYVAFRKEAPRRGTPVMCSKGEGVVTGYQVPKDALVVKLSDGTIVEEKIDLVQLVGGELCSCGEPLSERGEPEAGEKGGETMVVGAEAPEVAMAAGRDLGPEPENAGPAAISDDACEVDGEGGTKDGDGSPGKSPQRDRSERGGVDRGGARGESVAAGGRETGLAGASKTGEEELSERGSAAEDQVATPGEKKKPRRRRRRPRSKKPRAASEAAGTSEKAGTDADRQTPTSTSGEQPA